MLGLENSCRFFITGDTPDEAEQKAAALIEALKRNPNSRSLRAQIVPEDKIKLLRLYPDRQSLAASGLDIQQLSKQIGISLGGTIPTRILYNGRETDVKIRVKEDARVSREDILELPIPSSSGGVQRTGSLADMRIETEQPRLTRENRRDAAVIAFEQQPESAACRLIEDFGAHKPAGASIKEEIPQIIKLFIISMLLLYLCLGFQFESFSLPLFLMLSIPAGLSGLRGSSLDKRHLTQS